MLLLKGGDVYTSSPVVVGELALDEEVLSLMRVGCGVAPTVGSEEPFAYALTCVLQDGQQTVQVVLLNDAGNETMGVSDDIWVDRTPLSIPRFAEGGGLTRDPSFAIGALAVPSDDGSGTGLRSADPYEVVYFSDEDGDGTQDLVSAGWDGAAPHVGNDFRACARSCRLAGSPGWSHPGSSTSWRTRCSSPRCS